MLKKRTNEESKLYKKFVEENQKKVVLDKSEDIEREELKEKKKREEKEAKQEARNRRVEEKQRKRDEKRFKFSMLERITIAVCTLTNKNVGCTYLCNALALCFMNKGKNVCIINLRTNENEQSVCDEYRSKEEMVTSGEEYQVIIYNIGNLEENENAKIEAKLAMKKIMMCLYNESFIRKLSSKVEDEGFDDWKYIFNFVPESKYKEIDDLMEDYQYSCLPLYAYTKKEIDKIAWKCLK